MVDTVVLNDIPFQIQMTRLLQTLSIKADSTFAREVAELVEAATAIGKPKVVYRKAHIDVSLSESYMMSPVKSTSGIRYYAATKFVSCQLCQEPRCPTREAPYDTALLNKYYQ
jgi:hypothetical protein